jgi:hypothetical protein
MIHVEDHEKWIIEIHIHVDRGKWIIETYSFLIFWSMVARAAMFSRAFSSAMYNAWGSAPNLGLIVTCLKQGRRGRLGGGHRESRGGVLSVVMAQRVDS